MNTAATTYALGAALQVDAKGFKNNVDGNEPDRRTVNTFHWYDGAVADKIEYTPSLSNPGTVWTTTYGYDVLGGAAQLERANIQDGRPRQVAWTLDMMGQAIRRSEKDNQTGGDPHEIWHRLSGRQMGYVGHSVNNDVNYAQSVSNRAFGEDASAHADFDLAYNHITTFEQGSMGGAYIARAGDTLQSIAANLWGDASLWYKIAEANGLSGQSALSEGQSLLIPVGVQRNENNATTFQPYDPLEVLGNTSPTSPKPKTGGCGVMGQVLLVVIAVVVAVVTAGAALAALAPAAAGITSVGVGISTVLGGGLASAAGSTALAVGIGAAAGAAGSIVSQGIGVATGIQEKFSWNAVALAAIGGGVGAGLGSVAAEGTGLAARLLQNQFVSGAVGSAITQGVGYATGLQDKFSWAGVAGAGVGAWVGAQIGGEGFAAKLARNTASGIANAATRSLMNGGEFGDNLMAALPDVIGQTIGESIAGGISGQRSVGTNAPSVSKRAPQTAKEVAEMHGCEVGDAMWAIGARPSKVVRDKHPELAADLSIPPLKSEEIVVTAPQPSRRWNPLNAVGRGYTQYRRSREEANDHVVASLPEAARLPAQLFFAREEGRIDGVERYASGMMNFLTEAGRRNADYMLGYTFDSFALVTGTRLPPDAPSLLRRLQQEVDTAGDVANFIGDVANSPSAHVEAAGDYLEAQARGAVRRLAEDPAGFVREYTAIETEVLLNVAPIPGAKGVGLLDDLGRARATVAALPDEVLRVFPAESAGARAAVAIKGPPCFAAGTLIHTREGLKAIETIAVGDFVWSQPEFQGERAWRRVNEVFHREPQDMVDVTIADGARRETITATTEHPFWVKGQGWTGAQDLAEGALVELTDGRDARVVLVERLEDQRPVFNFAVDGFHTYYVGDLGVWVHNTSKVADALAHIRRNTPGAVSVSGELRPASGRWLDAATPTPIPSQVAAELVGKEFATFDDLRQAIWLSIGKNDDLLPGFTRSNVGNMRGGYAPFAPRPFQVNASNAGMRFNLHHKDPIELGGAVYDLSNLLIVSPKVHYQIHY